MTTKQRIISFLQNYPEGIDDDELARILGLSFRQQANSCCRELQKEGLVMRRQVNGKIHNFWAGIEVALTPSAPANAQGPQPHPRTEDWFWEGNIQSAVVDQLKKDGFQIRSVADTASHQKGIDIVAEKEGKPLWVTVKGYPKGTKKTNPAVQAGHWFKQAVFDIIAYRERDKEVLLAVALPDYPRYHTFSQKITWLKPVAKFSYIWVKGNGEILVE